MKKLILILPSLFLYANSYSQKIKIGFRGGATFSNFYNHNASVKHFDSFSFGTISLGNGNPTTLPKNPTYSNNSYYKTNFFKDMRVGFSAGFFIDWEMNKKWNLELSLNYSQKGINVKYKLNSDTLHPDNSHTYVSYQFISNIRLDYITVPIVFKYKLDKKERFYVLGGIYNSVAVGSKFKNSTVYHEKDDTGYESISESHPDKAYYHIFDSGLIGGMGVQWPLKNKWSIGLELRGALGLISIPAKYDEAGFADFSANTKNISFQTGLKLQYSLK